MKEQYSPSLVEGIRHTKEMVVKETDIDSYWGIGQLNVIAVPVIIGFIEQTILELLNPYIQNGYDSSSVEINLKHNRQAKQGEVIHCTIHLKFIDENNLFFDVSVIDSNKEELTHGAIERVIMAKSDN